MSQVSPRLITAAACLLVGVMIFVRVGPLTLSGIDAACYARIAADLAERPFSTWLDVLTTTPADLAGASVSNCSPLTPWVAGHLFSFHWKATPVGCDDAAPWWFDGVSLERTFQK